MQYTGANCFKICYKYFNMQPLFYFDVIAV